MTQPSELNKHGAQFGLRGPSGITPRKTNLVPEMVLVHEVPPPSALVKWPVIALSWEVNPLWVAKLQLAGNS